MPRVCRSCCGPLPGGICYGAKSGCSNNSLNGATVVLSQGGTTLATGTTSTAPGIVFTVKMTNVGSGYFSTPTVTFSAPPAGGVTATGTAFRVSGTIIGVTLTNQGSGYTSAPTVTFTGGGGSGAAGTVVLGSYYCFTNLANGSYTVTSSYPGYTTASATVTVSGTVVTSSSTLAILGTTICCPNSDCPFPTTLHLTDSLIGSLTLTYNAPNGDWEGSIVYSFPGYTGTTGGTPYSCTGGTPYNVTMNYKLACTNGANLTVLQVEYLTSTTIPRCPQSAGGVNTTGFTVFINLSAPTCSPFTMGATSVQNFPDQGGGTTDFPLSTITVTA